MTSCFITIITQILLIMEVTNSVPRRCYCRPCRGRLVSRWTQMRHSDRSQYRPGRKELICGCSQHPLGQIVHRATYFRHIKLDIDAGTTPTITIDTSGVQDFIPDSIDPITNEALFSQLI